MTDKKFTIVVNYYPTHIKRFLPWRFSSWKGHNILHTRTLWFNPTHQRLYRLLHTVELGSIAQALLIMSPCWWLWDSTHTLTNLTATLTPLPTLSFKQWDTRLGSIRPLSATTNNYAVHSAPKSTSRTAVQSNLEIKLLCYTVTLRWNEPIANLIYNSSLVYAIGNVLNTIVINNST